MIYLIGKDKTYFSLWVFLTFISTHENYFDEQFDKNSDEFETFDAGFECTEDMLVTMHERAHRYCFIANSVSDSLTVDIQPERASS